MTTPDQQQIDLWISELIQLGYSFKKENTLIMTPAHVAKHLAADATNQVEVFFCLTLDTAHKVINSHKLFQGTLNNVTVHPRDVFRAAIADNAQSIIVAHNHPSGNNDPSDDDITMTTRLIEAGKLIGIEVLDHVIFGLSGFNSMRETTYLWN